MASAASRVVGKNAEAILPLIRGSLLNRVGSNLAREQKLLNHLSFGRLLKAIDCDRPPVLATSADLLVSKFGFSIQDMKLRPRKEASDVDEDDFDDDSDSEDFDDDDDDDENYDEISEECAIDIIESEEEDDDTPKRRK